MKRPVKGWLFWTPRILGILFAAFVSLFALDVFEEGYGFWEALAGFAIHLIPTAIVLIVLAIAWRWEWVGGILFIALGTAYIVATRGGEHWSAYLLIAGPLVLIGLLFLMDRRYGETLEASENG